MGRNARPPTEENKRFIEHAKKSARQIARVKDRNAMYMGLIEAATYDKRFVNMCDVLPEGGRGKAKIEHFRVDAACSHVSKLRALLNPDTRWYEYIAPGRYARLTIGDVLFMTDTGHERFSSLPLIDNARGHVLVTGLGLGMVLLPLLDNPEVESVCIVENNGDVAQLVLPPLVEYIGKRYGVQTRSRDVCISLGDAWTWDPFKETIKKGQKFDTIFHDIWATFGPELLPEFRKLKRRYRKWLKKGGWMGCWAEETCRQLRREEIRKFREVQAAIGGDVTKLPPLQGTWKTDDVPGG